MDEKITGLSEKEAIQRLKQYGTNTLAGRSRFYILKQLWNSFFGPLTAILLFASFISLFLGNRIDFAIIFFIVVASGCITFFQHFKADHAAEALKKKVLLQASVIRDGKHSEIPFSEVTIGDIVFLSVGDIVPADLELLETKELSINQSTLTGESYPEKKDTKNKGTQMQAFAGTQVVTGEGIGKVIAIGKKTKIGLLSQTIVIEKPATSFDRGIRSFSILILWLVLALSLFVFGINVLLHHDFLLSLLFTVALAVGLTPDLMPLVITVTLSNGAIRMDKHDVIVKYLPSIQNLGSMDILCTDKTGTLTESVITVNNFENSSGEKDENILALAKVNAHFQSGFKNPIDISLLDFSKAIDIASYKKIDEIPFDFDRKRVSAIVEKDKQVLLITKGAAKNILDHCHYIGNKTHTMTTVHKDAIIKKIEKINNSGDRLIAVAYKTIQKKNSYDPADEKDLIYAGFITFHDPVKIGVRETITELYKLGVDIKILTGDNDAVTRKVCEEASIPADASLTGEQITNISTEELENQVEKISIFSHLTPEQKSQIIKALRKRKHVVGYLGDGINDAPPLKSADVGISVNNGSDIAKEVADIILMRKSLLAITHGIVEGRKTYANSFKYIMMSLSSNFGNMMTVAVASIFLPFLPLLPIQILLINFLYDVSQITVPNDNVDKHLILKPREWNMNFLKRFLIVFAPMSSLFDLLTFAILLFGFHATAEVFRTGWFIESIVTETIIVFAIRTQVVPFFKSKPGIPLVISALLTIVAGFLFLFLPIRSVFEFTKLPILFLIIVFGEVGLYLLFVELEKLWFYKRFDL